MHQIIEDQQTLTEAVRDFATERIAPPRPGMGRREALPRGRPGRGR